MESNTKDKKTFIINVVVVFLAFAAYKLIGTFGLSKITNNPVRIFASEVTITLCAIVAAFITRKLSSMKLTAKGFGTGIWVGMVILIMAVFRIITWIITYIKSSKPGTLPDWVERSLQVEQHVTIPVSGIILFVIAMILVGIAEELLFRGVLLNGCLDYFGEDSLSSIRKSVFISSCIFGLFHIFNVFIGATFIGSLAQAINAVAMGMIFGAIYIRSGKNIWPCIFLHGIHDFSSFINSGVLEGKSIGDTISAYDLSVIPSILMFIALALFLLRKKKLLPFVNEKQ